MQEPLNPLIAILILIIIITIVIIIILVAKIVLKSRKPYQFTEDITDLNKIFAILPREMEEGESRTPEAPPSMLPEYPLKHREESEQNE